MVCGCRSSQGSLEAATWRTCCGTRMGLVFPGTGFYKRLWGKKPDHHKFCCCEVNEGWMCQKCHLLVFDMRPPSASSHLLSPSLPERLFQATRLILQKDFPSGKVKCFFFGCLFFLRKGKRVARAAPRLSLAPNWAGLVAQSQPRLLPRSLLAGGKQLKGASCSSGRGWISCLGCFPCCALCSIRGEWVAPGGWELRAPVPGVKPLLSILCRQAGLNKCFVHCVCAHAWLALPQV